MATPEVIIPGAFLAAQLAAMAAEDAPSPEPSS